MPLQKNGLPSIMVSRRQWVKGMVAVGVAAAMPLSLQASVKKAMRYAAVPVLDGEEIELTVSETAINITGRDRMAALVNGSLPSPTLRLKEGQRVRIRVKNTMAEDTSIHWHGIILPSAMDGVPGLSFHGIKSGGEFVYEFDLHQSGTYWYHSHSGWQEQMGMYGALIIEPKVPEPFHFDKDFIVMLSDWSDERPEQILRHLKIDSTYYALNNRTWAQTVSDIKEQGLAAVWQDRRMWNEMRMSPNDISDVTAYTYTYLMNGRAPEDGWRGVFSRGDVVRLRFINASAMTFFDVRIPGLKMTVVAADGQLIQPVDVDDFRIGNAETYDVLVRPVDESAYTVFAQAIDRSGYACGTLAVSDTENSIVPALDAVPVLTHDDMGMSMKTMMAYMPDMDMSATRSKNMMGKGSAGFGSALPVVHADTEMGPHVEARAEAPKYRLDDPGVGLRDHAEKLGRKVLTYAMLKNYYPTQDRRQPSREIQLHLTGNMHRYMWSINGVEHAEPIELEFGERVRFTLVNDTMMNHPIHLHGLWSELETGDPDYIPKKHTVIVQPGSKISYLVTADAKGLWAFHCHLLFHMASMFRVVKVQ